MTFVVVFGFYHVLGRQFRWWTILYYILITMMNREASIVDDTGTSAIPKIKSGSALTVIGMRLQCCLYLDFNHWVGNSAGGQFCPRDCYQPSTIF